MAALPADIKMVFAKPRDGCCGCRAEQNLGSHVRVSAPYLVMPPSVVTCLLIFTTRVLVRPQWSTSTPFFAQHDCIFTLAFWCFQSSVAYQTQSPPSSSFTFSSASAFFLSSHFCFFSNSFWRFFAPLKTPYVLALQAAHVGSFRYLFKAQASQK